MYTGLQKISFFPSIPNNLFSLLFLRHQTPRLSPHRPTPSLSSDSASPNPLKYELMTPHDRNRFWFFSDRHEGGHPIHGRTIPSSLPLFFSSMKGSVLSVLFFAFSEPFFR